MSRGAADCLRAGTALGILLVATVQAGAGAFAIREQSAYGQGTSFAGVAAGGALSSMFWNPATMTQVPGIQSETALTGILPHATHTPLPGSSLAVFGGAPNSGESALVPAGYFSWQIMPNIWLGMSTNAPFGLSVSFPDLWAGRNYGADTTLKTYTATPSIAWQINNWISVGAGVQIQYADARLQSGLLPAFGSNAILDGAGWGFGFAAGVTFTPWRNTTIGLGWRSAIDQDINGSLAVTSPLPLTTPGSVNVTVDLPDIVTLGIRHHFDDRWTFMGTVEWSNWSRIGTAVVTQPNGLPATIGGSAVTLPFQYDDGWFFSIGSEYRWSDRLTLRSGIGYEISPISDQVRTPRLPDNDRFWLSVGASWEVWKGFSFDVAYSHLWVKDPDINISATSGNPWFNPGLPFAYIGDVSAHVDIFSIGMKYRWDEAAPVRKALITK
ncbi:MAG TPA: OmpP1/FadL family transporter [Pseudolabrys sp.]|nr:OmpP1/FadL family transporter [Pseudolabrys sp.]